MAGEDGQRRLEPARMRPPVLHPLVAEDSLQHACILVGMLAGRYTRRQAAQAIGCTSADLQNAITSAGLAGEELVRTAIAGHFHWNGLWSYHIRQAQADGRPSPEQND